MFVHSVYFWLREGLTPAERDHFVAGLRSLRGIAGVAQGYIGVPASTDRPVIDRTYSWSLVFVFANQADHDAYQVAPVHHTFRAECSGYWTTVRVFDSVTVDKTP
jgi:hypothetical protein